MITLCIIYTFMMCIYKLYKNKLLLYLLSHASSLPLYFLQTVYESFKADFDNARATDP